MSKQSSAYNSEDSSQRPDPHALGDIYPGDSKDKLNQSCLTSSYLSGCGYHFSVRWNFSRQMQSEYHSVLNSSQCSSIAGGRASGQATETLLDPSMSNLPFRKCGTSMFESAGETNSEKWKTTLSRCTATSWHISGKEQTDHQRNNMQERIRENSKNRHWLLYWYVSWTQMKLLDSQSSQLFTDLWTALWT